MNFNYSFENEPPDSVEFYFNDLFHNDYSFLDSKEGVITHKYEMPYYYKPEVMCKGKEILKTELLVPSTGWFCLLKDEGGKKYRVRSEAEIIQDSMLFVSSETVTQYQIDSNSDYYSSFIYAKDFKVSADKMQLKLKVKNTEVKGNYDENDVIVGFVSKSGYHQVHFTDPCCYNGTVQQIGEITYLGSQHDNSSFAISKKDWFEITLRTNRNLADIFVDDVLVESIPYENKLDSLKTLHFSFRRNCFIDHVSVFNTNSNTLVFEDNFSR